MALWYFPFGFSCAIRFINSIKIAHCSIFKYNIKITMQPHQGQNGPLKFSHKLTAPRLQQNNMIQCHFLPLPAKLQFMILFGSARQKLNRWVKLDPLSWLRVDGFFKSVVILGMSLWEYRIYLLTSCAPQNHSHTYVSIQVYDISHVCAKLQK